MYQTVDAMFDGAVLRPDKPLKLKANTRVRVPAEKQIPHGSFVRENCAFVGSE